MYTVHRMIIFIMQAMYYVINELHFFYIQYIYKPDSKKVGTLYKLWIKKECNDLQIS